MHSIFGSFCKERNCTMALLQQKYRLLEFLAALKLVIQDQLIQSLIAIKMKKQIGFIMMAFTLTILFSQCTPQQKKDNKIDGENTETALDFSEKANWVSFPSTTKNVDVFYLYPTVSSNASGNMDIANEEERALAKGIFMAQASVFEEDCNLFAPFYRQLTTAAKPETPTTQPSEMKEFVLGLTDVLDAFDYYIEHLNQGRPFFIAGHSQGSMMVLELLKERFGNNEALRKQLIAAYAIGSTVTQSDLDASGLKAAKGADDFGVIISFNTQSRTSAGGPMLLPGAICINPLNWKTDSTKAPASENLGARFYNNDTGEFLREEKSYCDAQINTKTAALLTTLPEADVETLVFGPYKEGVYHRYDYAFWYRNLQENVGVRVDAFLKQED